MKDKKQIMLDELSKESEMVIATAYLYAKNFDRYGEDITRAWITAIQQKAILEKAYNIGYSDALKEREERKAGKWIYHEKSISTGFKDLRECSCCHCYFKWKMPRNSYCPNCGAEMGGTENG